jgi:hypothetical protein
VAEGLDDLERWAAEARAREAAEARVRERWLRTQAEEGTRFTGVLAGMVERAAPVTVIMTTGRQVAGRVTALGEDFVAVELPGGRTTLVARRAVAWVRGAPDMAERGRVRADDRAPDHPDDGAEAAGTGPPATLADVLAQSVASRPRVTIWAQAASLTGELRAVGIDVVAVELAASPPGLAYVPLRSIYEISFLDSG